MDRQQRALHHRALALWPGLDRRALRRCGGDASRIATLVSRRTALSRDAILTLLRIPQVSKTDATFWFG